MYDINDPKQLQAAIEASETPQYIIDAFGKYNKKFFKNKLSKPYFLWNVNDVDNYMPEAYSYYKKSVLGPLIIFKSSALHGNLVKKLEQLSPEIHKKYLLHEMIHLAIGDKVVENHHGQLFTEYANRIGKELGYTKVVAEPTSNTNFSSTGWPHYDDALELHILTKNIKIQNISLIYYFVMDIWNIIQNDWHKIIVVILVLAQVWKYFFEYIRPTIKHDKLPQPINIVLPPQGCQITVVPLSVEEKKD